MTTESITRIFVQINLRKTDKNTSFVEEVVIVKSFTNPFTFAANDPTLTYTFTTNLISCAGEVGEESDEASCVEGRVAAELL